MENSKEINALVQAIRKDFGAGALSLLGDNSELIEIQKDRISSGLYQFDEASNGGLVKGGISEIYGDEGSGKTTLALTILASCQNKNMQPYYVDAEHKLNIEYAKKIGVRTEEMLITQPQYGEQGLDIMKSVAQSGLVDIIVVDSVASLVPKVDIDGDYTDANMGAHARMMSKMCRVMAPICQQNGVHLMLINQTRQKIGVFFGSPETTTGGKAIKFYAGMRIKATSSQVKRGDTVDETKRDVNLNFVKMQWGTPYKRCTLRLNLGEGFDYGVDVVEYCLSRGILTMASSSVQFKGKSIGNGRANAGVSIMENQSLREKIIEEIENVRQNGNGKKV